MTGNLLHPESQGLRLKSFFDEKSIVNSERYKILEYKAPTSYNGIISGRKGISFTVLVKLHLFDKNLNLHWLVTGEGKMFLNEEEDVVDTRRAVIDKVSDNKSVQLTEIEQLKQEVNQLKTQMQLININMNSLLTEKEKHLYQDINILKGNKKKELSKMNLRD